MTNMNRIQVLTAAQVPPLDTCDKTKPMDLDSVRTEQKLISSSVNSKRGAVPTVGVRVRIRIRCCVLETLKIKTSTMAGSCC